jgi:hypothetical protein
MENLCLYILMKEIFMSLENFHHLSFAITLQACILTKHTQFESSNLLYHQYLVSHITFGSALHPTRLRNEICTSEV